MKSFIAKTITITILVSLYWQPVFAQEKRTANIGKPVSPNVNALTQYSNRSLALGQPRISDPKLYNAFDLNGSALGLLEREKKDLKLEFRSLSSDQSSDLVGRETSSGNLMLPSVYFNIPGLLGSNLYFRKIGDGSQSVDFENTLDLYTGGADIAVGLESGYAQAALSLHTIFLGEAKDTSGNKRFIFGIPKLEIGLGSQPHKLIRIGGKFGVGGSFDSLWHAGGYRGNTYIGQSIFERYATLIFPAYGFHVDFGDSTIIPLFVNMGVNIDREIAWGNYKNRTSDQPANRVFWDYPNRTTAFGIDTTETQYSTLRTSGYEFSWNGMYYFKNKGVHYRPALMFGFWNRATQRWKPGNDVNDPFSNNGSCVNGQICFNEGVTRHGQVVDTTDWNVEDGLVHNWTFGGFNLGLGLSLDIYEYVTGYTEWEFNSLTLKVPDSTKQYDEDDRDFRGYNRILVGVEGNLHNIPQWKIPKEVELYVRASFATGAENSNSRKFRPYYLQYFNRYTFEERNLYERGYYIPEIGAKVDWYTFNLGFGSSFWNGIVSGDIYLSFYYQDNQFLNDDFSGIEIGSSVKVAL
ncbi:hypothetical protein ACFL5V_10075 [Fibrobacterota bacterium]